MIHFVAMASVFLVGGALRDQSIAVKGRLTCGALPAADVLVKLWDEDIDLIPFSWFDPDDLLDRNYSNSNGEFYLAGRTTELTAMDPILSIYHDCNDGIKSGVRKVSFGLPDQYITASRTPARTVDTGVINLELSHKEEKRMDLDEEKIKTFQNIYLVKV